MRLTRSFRTPHPNPERKPSAVPARRSPPRRKRAQEAGRRRGSPELARSLAPAAASSVNETARTPGSPRPRPSRALRLRKTQRHPFPVTPDSAPPGKRPPAARGERTSQPLTPPNAARPLSRPGPWFAQGPRAPPPMPGRSPLDWERRRPQTHGRSRAAPLGPGRPLRVSAAGRRARAGQAPRRPGSARGGGVGSGTRRLRRRSRLLSA